MRYSSRNHRRYLPKPEQVLLKKIEEDIESELNAGGGWWSTPGYDIVYNRLHSLYLRGDYSFRRHSILPDELCEATEMTLITVGVNKIRKIPSEMGNLQNLDQLFMGNNLFTEIPKSMTELRHLRFWEIQNNRIERLPDHLEGLESLRDFSIGNNLISKIPKSIGEMRNLVRLRMPFNNVEKLPESMTNLKYLQTLRYGDNNVKELPEWIGELESLVELSLHDNKLETIPDSFANLKYLRDLDLRNNNLEEFPVYVLAELQNLENIYLRGNPFSDRFMKKFKAMSRMMPRHLRIDGYQIDAYFNKDTAF